MRLDVIASHEKLRSRDFVCPFSELPPDVQEDILNNPEGTHYIPWRVVHKPTSLSTPTRMVFDASSKTPGGESLNSILAKGSNTLANLNNKLLKFRCMPSGFTADIKMAYNAVKLHPSHYKYQLYVWREGLDPTAPTITMVIKTIIYGVRPSGNQLGAGISKLADFVCKNHPEHASGAVALKSNSYVDDVLHPSPDLARARLTAESLSFTLNLADMRVKGFTYPGSPPHPDVSSDGRTVGLVGHIWEPENDLIGPDIKPLFFGKIKRGKYPDLISGDFNKELRDNFTRRTLLGKVASVYDPTGLLTPVVSRFKLCLHTLCIDEKLDWDDKVPDGYLESWIKNISDIQRLREVRFRRTIIPADAANIQVQLIISSDASRNIAVSTVHARVLKKDNTYSCQLLTAKSKLVNMSTVPKAEIRAAVMGATLGHTAKFNLETQYEGALYCSDSSIALYWIGEDQRALQTYVRNCVIEIRRFSDTQQWFHIASENNIADLGTRTAEVDDITLATDWQEGKDWMRGKREDMPLRTIAELTLTNEEKRVASQESKIKDILGVVTPVFTNHIAQRYGFSKYLVDPISYDWLKVLRITALVLRFVKRCRPVFHPVWFPAAEPPPTDNQVNPNIPTQLEIRRAENCIFYKCTAEVKKFSPSKDFKENTVELNGILHYAGRILDASQIDCPEDPFLDSPPLCFVKPVVDRHSPVAYSVMLHAHTRLARHKGINFSLRESRSVAYIFRGRELSIEVDKNCRPCKKHKKRLVKVELGKLHQTRLTIAPPFYICQVDLFGPLNAQCEHNHRSTVKIYGTVFKCPATSAVAINVMQSYSTEAFLQAYTRFSSKHGHPSQLAIDQGSQLVSACKNMQISILNITEQLSVKYQVGVKYTVCAVSGHNQHGQVERSIKEIKSLIDRVYSGLKLDILGYETCFNWVASEINNLPICLASKTENLEYTDVITPSRILLGRNNRRSLSGYARLDTPSRLITQMDKVYDNWWKAWANQKLVDFIPQPVQWTATNCSVKVGDVVLFLKEAPEQHFGEPVWKIGRIIKTPVSKQDGITRTVVIEYKNANEKIFRTTTRAVRSLAVVHSEGELDIVQQVEAAAAVATSSPPHDLQDVPDVIDVPVGDLLDDKLHEQVLVQTVPTFIDSSVSPTIDDDLPGQGDDQAVGAHGQGLLIDDELDQHLLDLQPPLVPSSAGPVDPVVRVIMDE